MFERETVMRATIAMAGLCAAWPAVSSGQSAGPEPSNPSNPSNPARPIPAASTPVA